MSIILKSNVPLYETNYGAWVIELKNFIDREIFSLFISSKETKDRLLQDKYMEQYWVPVFTQQGYEGQSKYGSYETYEKLGDNVMESVFSYMLMRVVPNINAEDLNNMINKYLSVDYQGTFSLNRGWANYVRTKFFPTIKVAEDLVEAFFGGLYTVANLELGIGRGDALAYGLMQHFFLGVNLDINSSINKAAKTTLKEDFKDYLALNEPRIVSYELGNGQIRLELVMDNTAKNTFNRIIEEFNKRLSTAAAEKGTPFVPIEMFTNVIATAEGKYYDVVKKQLYKDAVLVFENKRLTNTFIKSAKNAVRSYTDPLLNEGLKKAQAAGYKYIDFATPKSKNKYTFGRLIGYRPDNTQETLGTLIVTSDLKRNLDRLLLNQYLGKPMPSNINYQYV